MTNDYNDSAICRYDEILADFKNLAINRFEWENLPQGLNGEILEEMLIERGQVFCFKRSNGGIVILPCTGSKEINVYGQYENFNIMGLNGKFVETVNADEGIRIKNNPLATPNINNLEIYAKRINDVEMTQDVNLFQHNIPKIVLSDENGKLTAKAIIQQVKKFKMVILGRTSLPSQLSTSEVLDTSAPYLLDKLQDHKNNLINEVLTYLGINNNNSDKKERLVVDEVNANNEFVNINLDLMYDIRKTASDEINKMFDLNIKVSKREVEQNGTIHIDSETTGGK